MVSANEVEVARLQQVISDNQNADCVRIHDLEAAMRSMEDWWAVEASLVVRVEALDVGAGLDEAMIDLSDHRYAEPFVSLRRAVRSALGGSPSAVEEGE